MSMSTGKADQIPGFRVAPLWDQIKRQRQAARRQPPPTDVRSLMRLFRHVELDEGYQLGYLRVGSRESGWIWPYAAPQLTGEISGPPEALARIPVDRLAAGRLSSDLKQVIQATLNKHLHWEPHPQGLLEYALLIRELWSLKSESQEAEWLGLDFVLARHVLQRILRGAGRSTIRSSLEARLDPTATLSGAGGSVSMLAFRDKPWKRILEIDLQVDPDGWVSWSSGRIVLNLES